MKINKEWVAAGITKTAATSMKNASNRYKNQYTAPTYTEKAGDAIATIGGWHGSSETTWLSGRNNDKNNLIRAGLIRAHSGSIFSYYGHGYAGINGDLEDYKRDAFYTKLWSSRAVVVVGSGV